MTLNKTIVASVILTAVFAATGCEKKEEAKPGVPPAKAAADAAKAKAEETAAKAKAEADTAAVKADAKAADIKTKADTAATETKADADAAAAKTKIEADATAAKADVDATAAKTKTDAAAAGEAATDNVAKAKSLLEKVIVFIKEKKFDDASASLKDLDSLKASLPESMQKQIGDAHKSLDVAKAGDSLKGLMK